MNRCWALGRRRRRRYHTWMLRARGCAPRRAPSASRPARVGGGRPVPGSRGQADRRRGRTLYVHGRSMGRLDDPRLRARLHGARAPPNVALLGPEVSDHGWITTTHEAKARRHGCTCSLVHSARSTPLFGRRARSEQSCGRGRRQSQVPSSPTPASLESVAGARKATWDGRTRECAGPSLALVCHAWRATGRRAWTRTR